MTDTNKKIGQSIEDAINNTCCYPQEVAEYMANNAHRYLQQEFGKICLEYIKLKAKHYEEKRYDGRNEWFCKTASEIVASSNSYALKG